MSEPSYTDASLRAAVAAVRSPDTREAEFTLAAGQLAGFVSNYLDYCDEIDPPQEEDQ